MNKYKSFSKLKKGEYEMEAYKMHDFINTNVESHQNETVLIYTCETSEFDVSLTKSTTLSFIVSKRILKLSRKMD